MKYFLILLFVCSCKSYQISPRKIDTDCNPPTYQSLQSQPKDATCYKLRF